MYINIPNIDVVIDDSRSSSNDSKRDNNKKSLLENEKLKGSKNIRVINFLFLTFKRTKNLEKKN